MHKMNQLLSIGVGTLVCGGAAMAGECEPTWSNTLGSPGMVGSNVVDFDLYDDGSGAGEQLYATGQFASADGNPDTTLIAKWSGSEWVSVGGGLQNQFSNTLEVFNGDLIVGGFFDSAGNVSGTEKLARWDGAQWHSMDADLAFFTNSIWDLETFDDGSGEALYVAGNYTDIGGAGGPDFIARWDGSSYSEVGGPIAGAGVPLIVLDLQIADLGDGEHLYAGGRFLEIGGVDANHIAKWNGTTWEPLGSGIAGDPPFVQILSMTVYDDGSGPALIAGGSFTSAGGVPALRVAKWDGTQWQALGSGLNNAVQELIVFDDGTGKGSQLYAIGNFTATGNGTPVSHIARWTGSEWEPVGTGLNDSAFGAIVYDFGQGQALNIAGSFSTANGVSASRIVSIVACEDDSIPGDIDGDNDVDVTDLLTLLGDWGECPDCPSDIDGNGSVDVSDLLTLLGNWG